MSNENIGDVQRDEALVRLAHVKMDRDYAALWHKVHLQTEETRRETAAADLESVRKYVALRYETEEARQRAANAEAEYWIARALKEGLR